MAPNGDQGAGRQSGTRPYPEIKTEGTEPEIKIEEAAPETMPDTKITIFEIPEWRVERVEHVLQHQKEAALAYIRVRDMHSALDRFLSYWPDPYNLSALLFRESQSGNLPTLPRELTMIVADPALRRALDERDRLSEDMVTRIDPQPVRLTIDALLEHIYSWIREDADDAQIIWKRTWKDNLWLPGSQKMAKDLASAHANHLKLPKEKRGNSWLRQYNSARDESIEKEIWEERKLEQEREDEEEERLYYESLKENGPQEETLE